MAGFITFALMIFLIFNVLIFAFAFRRHWGWKRRFKLYLAFLRNKHER